MELRPSLDASVGSRKLRRPKLVLLRGQRWSCARIFQTMEVLDAPLDKLAQCVKARCQTVPWVARDELVRMHLARLLAGTEDDR